MYLRAQEHLRNCKKALSVVSCYDSSYKTYSSTGNLPSGMVMEDYYMFVRKNMYSLLVKSKTTSTEESPTSLIDAHDDSDMPETWCFPGFLVFVLMGPIVPPSLLSYRAKLLMTSPSSSSSSRAVDVTESMPARTGRTAARKASAKEAALIRNQSGPADNSRGYTTNQRLRVAGIAQSKALVTILSNRDRARTKEGVLKILGQRVKRQEGLIASKKFIILNIPANDPKRMEHVNELNDLHTSLQALMQELDAAEESAIEDAMKTESELVSLSPTADFVDLTIRRIIDDDEKQIAGSTASTGSKKQKVDEDEYEQVSVYYDPDVDEEQRSGSAGTFGSTPQRNIHQQRASAELLQDMDSTPQTQHVKHARSVISEGDNLPQPRNLASEETEVASSEQSSSSLSN